MSSQEISDDSHIEHQIKIKFKLAGTCLGVINPYKF